jgi:hypothetical protein
MKRKEIIEKLMMEGFSEKTLVNFTDGQLSSLSERILGEATQVTMTKLDKNKPADVGMLQGMLKDPVKNAEALKRTTIGEVDEETKTPTKKQLKSLDKNKNGKIDKIDFEMLRSKKKSPKKEVKEELKGNQSKLDANKNGKIDKEDFKLLKKGKTPTKKGSKLDQGSKLAMTLKKLKEHSETQNWVNSLVENNYHSLTTKNEIMELIHLKLNENETMVPMPKTKTKMDIDGNSIPEFMTYDAIIKAAEPRENPGIKEAPPTPDVDEPVKTPTKDPREDPFTPKQPEERPNPSPKAGIKKQIEKYNY